MSRFARIAILHLPQGIALAVALALFCALVLPHPEPALAFTQMDHPISPIGRFITIDERALYVQCQGSGGPVVFLESGLGGSSAEWSLVQSDVARETTVCAYDRAGEGQSDPDPGAPHSAGNASRDFAAIMTALHIEEPIVLTGFSFGGLLARYVASTNPRIVASLVLIDATPPVWTAMTMASATIDSRIDAMLRFSGLHPNAAEQVDILGVAEEVFRHEPARLPVFMLSSGVKSLSPGLAGDERANIAARLQADQARELDAQHEIVAGCTHAMPIECPEAVVGAILAAVDEVRRDAEDTSAPNGNAVVSSARRQDGKTGSREVGDQS